MPSQLKPVTRAAVLEAARKKWPDLIVCAHYVGQWRTLTAQERIGVPYTADIRGRTWGEVLARIEATT